MRGHQRKPISFAMKLRLFSVFLAALALVFAPLAMSSNDGMAMAHGANVQMTDMGGHCAGMDTPAEDDQKNSTMKMSCMSACSALPGAHPAVGELAPQISSEARSFLPKTLIGIHPESETPPPRLS